MHAKKNFARVSNCFANHCKFKCDVGLSWAWHYGFVLEGRAGFAAILEHKWSIHSGMCVVKHTNKWHEHTLLLRGDYLLERAKRRCWWSPFFFLYLLSAGGKRHPVCVCQLHWDFPSVDDWARPPQVQSEERRVQRHPLPEGDQEISAGEASLHVLN